MICHYCNKPCDGAYVSLNYEEHYAHPRCYGIAHPPMLATTLEDVIFKMEDPVLSRRICLQFLSSFQSSFQQEVIDEYNRELIKGHRRRIE